MYVVVLEGVGCREHISAAGWDRSMCRDVEGGWMNGGRKVEGVPWKVGEKPVLGPRQQRPISHHTTRKARWAERRIHSTHTQHTRDVRGRTGVCPP